MAMPAPDFSLCLFLIPERVQMEEQFKTLMAGFEQAIQTYAVHVLSLTYQKVPRSVLAEPQDAYGLEKLATEELCKHYTKDFGIECRIGRFHNIYGPFGTWKGGREKSPAAFCRKALTATE